MYGARLFASFTASYVAYILSIGLLEPPLEYILAGASVAGALLAVAKLARYIESCER